MQTIEDQTPQVKICIVGDTNTGKTCLAQRMVQDIFTETKNTAGADNFNLTVFDEKGRKLILNFWDTAGQERFRSLTNTFLKGCQICLVCFDTERSTFENAVNYWINNVRDVAYDCIDQIILVFTKFDKYNEESQEHQQYLNEVQQYAKENDLTLYLTSAKTGANIVDLKNYLGIIAFRAYDSLPQLEVKTININKNVEQTNDKKPCCI